MLKKIKLTSRKLLQRRKLRNRFALKQKNKGLLPRLSVYRSYNHIYAQIIDDSKSVTLTFSSTLSKDLRDSLKNKSCNIEVAKIIGKDIAKKALKCNIKEVIFDRGGYTYHGKVKALAEAARENGLKF